jgi:hypothetical protein
MSSWSQVAVVVVVVHLEADRSGKLAEAVAVGV